MVTNNYSKFYYLEESIFILLVKVEILFWQKGLWGQVHKVQI